MLNLRRPKTQRLETWAKGTYIVLLYLTVAIPVFFKMPISGVFLQTGLLLILFGSSLGIVSLLTLGRSYSFEICISPGFQLRKDGIYRLLKHPMRVGLAIEALGFVVLSGRSIGLIGLGLMGGLQVVRSLQEEAFLRKHLVPSDVQYFSEGRAKGSRFRRYD